MERFVTKEKLSANDDFYNNFGLPVNVGWRWFDEVKFYSRTSIPDVFTWLPQYSIFTILLYFLELLFPESLQGIG